MGSNCCSDKPLYLHEETNNSENPQEVLKFEVNKYKHSTYRGKPPQALKVTLNRPRKKYGELLDASASYWKLGKQKMTVSYELGIPLIVKNNFIFTAREYFAAKQILRILKEVKSSKILAKRNTV